jgi:hypothetical protein
LRQIERAPALADLLAKGIVGVHRILLDDWFPRHPRAMPRLRAFNI